MATKDLPVVTENGKFQEYSRVGDSYSTLLQDYSLRCAQDDNILTLDSGLRQNGY